MGCAETAALRAILPKVVHERVIDSASNHNEFCAHVTPHVGEKLARQESTDVRPMDTGGLDDPSDAYEDLSVMRQY